MTSDLPEKTAAGAEPPLRTLAARVMALSPEEAETAILDNPRATALVRALAPQDFRILVREIGPEDAVELLSLASNDQWRHILDVEAWQRDELSMARVEYWLDILRQADAARLGRWLAREEPELFKLWLFRTTQITALEEDEDPTNLPGDWFSLDGTLYLKVPEPEGPVDREALMRAVLDRVAEEDFELCRNLLFEASGVIPAETEEELFRLRNVRLAELGFSPFQEAVEIYAPISPERLPEAVRGMAPGQDEDAAPILPGEVRGASLFSEALSGLGGAPVHLELESEFAGLLNRVISADQITVESREDLAAVVRKVSGFLSMGLARIAGGRRDLAAAAILRRPLSALFRLGYSAVLAVSAKAVSWRRNAWFTRAGLPLEFWGEMRLGHVGGLLLKKPLAFDNYVSGRLHREFESLADVTRAEEALSSVTALDDLFAALDPGAAWLSIPGIAWDSLLLTPWARHLLGLSPEAVPLSAQELRRFFEELWEPSARLPFAVSFSAKESFLSFLTVASGWDAALLRDRLGRDLDALFTELEDEYGAVAIRDISPPLVRHVLAA